MVHINSFPDELLLMILSSVDFQNPSCLVCKRWLRIAQPLLFKQVDFWHTEFDQFSKFHRSLTSSNGLGNFVRELVIVEMTDGCGHLVTDQMIADCLHQVPGLERLRLNLGVVTSNLVVHRICLLLKLKYLSLNNYFGNDFRPLDAQFDPRHLLDLPTSLKELKVRDPPADLLEVLPEICANLHRTQLTSTADRHDKVAPSPLTTSKALNRTTGLLALKIDAGIGSRFRSSSSLAHSIAPTLSTFTFSTSSAELAIDVLSENPQIQHVKVHCYEWLSDLFERMPSLYDLRSLYLKVITDRAIGREEFQPMMDFISHSPQFNNLTLEQQWFNISEPSGFIEDLIGSITKKGVTCRLHTLAFGCLKAPSIDALQQLCKSAPMLKNLKVRLLSDDWKPYEYQFIEKMCSFNKLEEAELGHRIRTRCLGGDVVSWDVNL